MPIFRIHHYLNLGDKLSIDIEAATPDAARDRLVKQIKEQFPAGNVTLHIDKIKLVRG